MGRLTVLKQIARDLASQFGPDCEIVIHDLKTKKETTQQTRFRIIPDI